MTITRKKSKLKYETNTLFRDEHKKKIKLKYETNTLFRDEQKQTNRNISISLTSIIGRDSQKKIKIVLDLRK